MRSRTQSICEGIEVSMAEKSEPTPPLLSFESDIRPLFREKDRSSMLKSFDLWWYPDVVQHREAIVASLVDGRMPCDLAWSSSQIELFRRWIKQGSRP
jgi:hypothetical protein